MTKIRRQVKKNEVIIKRRDCLTSNSPVMRGGTLHNHSPGTSPIRADGKSPLSSRRNSDTPMPSEAALSYLKALTAQNEPASNCCQNAAENGAF